MRTVTQVSVCDRFKVEPSVPLAGSKLGIALSTIGRLPIHGLRHAPTESTSGWYFWCGAREISEAPDFFAPLHVEHIAEYLPAVVAYLDLPPGYRFMIDGSKFEDVWFDAALLAP